MKHIPVCQTCWKRLFMAPAANISPAMAQDLIFELKRYGRDAVLMKIGEKCVICTEKHAAENQLPASK